MRVAHLSDLHLGRRAFDRMERGWNLRERDLAGAFHGVVQELGRLSPDLILLAGDLFDQPDPPSTAFLTLTRGIRTLAELLPGVPVLAIAGERDTPLAPADPGPVAVLDALPGVEAASGAPRAVHLGELDAHVLMVPCRSVVRPPFPRLRPDPSARWNVLLLRGTPDDRADALVVNPSEWDYVALGGSHRANTWPGPGPGGVRTAGALERVGADPWREAQIEKGFWLVDLDRGTADLHPVPGRPVVDLAPVRVSDEAVEDGTRRLRDLVEGLPGGVEGKIVRVRLRGGMRGASAAGVSPGLLAAIRRRAAHLELQAGPDDERVPELLQNARESDPSSSPEPPRLVWHSGAEAPSGEQSGLELGPGLWAVVADSAELRVRVGEALSGPAISEGGPDGVGQLLALRGTAPRSGAPVGPAEPSSDALANDPATGADDSDESGLAQPGRKGADQQRPAPAGAGRTLEQLRSDWIEAVGDMEAASLEWVRERQEAESRLVAYRDRARELRERIRELERDGPDAACPTCHRPLAEAHPDMLAELREEWESVVQDGKWWKRRREQLDEQPQTLRDLDRRVLELQAELESLAEGSAAADSSAAMNAQAPAEPARVALPPAVRAATARELELAGDLLGRVTAGRLQLLWQADGELRVRSIDGEERAALPADLPLVSAALRLARAGHERPGAVVLDEFAASEGMPEVVRLLELIGEARPAIPVLAVVAPRIAQRVPELLAGRIEVRRDGDGALSVRAVGPGRSTVRLQG